MTYTGSWTYVKDNQDITVIVSERTNRFKKGWGDYIKSCTIQRTSINQPGHGNDFRFEVWEGGTKVFVSPPMTNGIRLFIRENNEWILTKRIEPMRRSAFRFAQHSDPLVALLLMAHPRRYATFRLVQWTRRFRVSLIP